MALATASRAKFAGGAFRMTKTFSAEVLVSGSGSAIGKALILPEPLSLWGGLDPSTGEIVDRRHPCSGQNVAGRVLFMIGSRGSSSASSILLEAVRAGTAPAAIVLQERDGILSLGAAVAAEMYGSSPPVIVLKSKDYTQFRDGDDVEVCCQEGSLPSISLNNSPMPGCRE